MKKKQTKKKIKNKRKNDYSETTAFSNLEKTSNTINNPKRSSSGIPKYVADRMARRIFFTAGIPTILGMSVFVVSYIIVTKNIAEIPPSSTIAISALFFLLGLAGLIFGNIEDISIFDGDVKLNLENGIKLKSNFNSKLNLNEKNI